MLDFGVFSSVNEVLERSFLLVLEVVFPLSVGSVVLGHICFNFLSEFLVHGRSWVVVERYKNFVEVHEEICVLKTLFVDGSVHNFVPDFFIKPTQFE